MIIESSPTNLDPRVGIDGQSERIDELLFDALLTRDEHFNVQPGSGGTLGDSRSADLCLPLASWRNVSRWAAAHIARCKVDVRFPAPGQDSQHEDLDLPFRGSDRNARRLTVVFHLKEPCATLLWNLSEGAIGIVPYGIARLRSRASRSAPGPFKFVSAETDKEVILERNDTYWGANPHLARVRFAVVPDATTRGSRIAKRQRRPRHQRTMSPDTIVTLERYPTLVVQHGPGTRLAYLAFNLRDPILQDVRVRQAHRLRSRPPAHDAIPVARLRRSRHDSILPPQSWAYDDDVPHYDYDPEQSSSDCSTPPDTRP